MAEYATKDDVQQIVGKAVDDLSRTVDDKIGKAVDDLSRTVDDKIGKAVDDLSCTVDDKIGKAVDDLSNIIGALAQQMGDAVIELKHENQEIKVTLNRFMNTVDGFMKRLDETETEQIARDRQFRRLVEWAHRVSEKTGIPLENL